MIGAGTVSFLFSHANFNYGKKTRLQYSFHIKALKQYELSHKKCEVWTRVGTILSKLTTPCTKTMNIILQYWDHATASVLGYYTTCTWDHKEKTQQIQQMAELILQELMTVKQSARCKGFKKTKEWIQNIRHEGKMRENNEASGNSGNEICSH